MENRFKFRIWDGENMIHESVRRKDKSEYGYAIDLSGILLSWDDTDYYPSVGDAEEEKEPGKFKIMQCTGLKDENGKEIYEGDILEIEVNILIVKWSMGEFFLKNMTHADNNLPIIDAGCGIILGNIYENLELLKSNQVNNAKNS